MTYTVNLMDKTSIVLTESEFAAMMESQNPLVHFPRLNRGINKLTISTYGPTESADRSGQKLGVLHDGTPVIRQFGEWVDAGSPVDEQGRHTVKLDAQFYPEVAADCVPTPQEFEAEYRHLTPDQRRMKMLVLGNGEKERRLPGHRSDLEKIEP